jgi:hypothetical protein
MRFRFAVGLLATCASVAGAQGGGGPANPACIGPAADACQQAIDFFDYMAPQLGTAMTGGNTTLAQGGSLGGFRFGLMPRFAIGVRVNAVQGNVPTYNPVLLLSPTAPPPQATTPPIATQSFYLPMPAVDLAIGVFKGFPLALSNVGGVDLLLSGAFVPTIESDEINITPDENLAFGYGVRVGLLQESLVVPGVGFSFMQRKFPVTTLSTATGPSSLTVSDLDLKSNAWRVTISKSLVLFGLAAGVGQDTYDASTSVTAQMPPTIGPVAVESKVTRTNFFADLSMNLLLIKLVASGGMVTGGDIVTWNAYDNAADKSRLYASLGVRFGL